MGQGCARFRRNSRISLMTLNDEEQDILAGKAGPVARLALQHQLKVGEFFSAKDFVPVTQAHIMADTESLGEAGVRWLEGLADAPEGQRHVRIPTITDPRGTDFAKAAFLGQKPAMLELERRTISAFVRLGVAMTDRIPNKQILIEEIAAWEHDRNANHTKADWQFTTKNARIKLKHLYPAI